MGTEEFAILHFGVTLSSPLQVPFVISASHLLYTSVF